MKVLFIGGEADRKVIECNDKAHSFIFPLFTKGEIKQTEYEIYNLSGDTYIGILSGQSLDDVTKILLENYAKPELIDTKLTIYKAKIYIEKEKIQEEDDRNLRVLESRLGFSKE